MMRQYYMCELHKVLSRKQWQHYLMLGVSFRIFNHDKVTPFVTERGGICLANQVIQTGQWSAVSGV